MPEKLIANPGAVWGATADAGTNQQVVEVVNNSGGTLLPGDVVVFATDTTGVNATTTTTANDKTVMGVVVPAPDAGLRTVASTETVAAGAVMRVCVRGPARINIGANVVAAGDLLTTSATAKVAATNAAAPAANAVTGSLIGVALEASGAKDANNTIRAYIGKF